MKAKVGALLVVASVAAAQTPQFDVASIKKNPLGGARVGVETPPGRFQATNTPLRFLIRWSYRIAEPRIVGGPGWIGVDRFDVSATASVEGWSGEARRRTRRRAWSQERSSAGCWSARTAEAPACAAAA
jgi:hypothetical protein